VSGDHPHELATRVAALADGRRLLVALDHDGTLSPIAARPEDALLATGARAALERLCPLADVVVVSGRGLDDLETRFAGLPVALVSEHGLRHRRRDGTVEQLTAGLAEHTLAGLRRQLAALLTDRPGWLVEDKGVGIAVHHRLVPDAELEPTLGIVRSLLEAAAAEPGPATASGPGGSVQAGRAVLEIRAAGADKGAALLRLAEVSAGDRTGRPAPPVVMVGDDATDEPALAVAERLGGVGVIVAQTPRRTAGSARLDGPDQVVLLLDALADALTAAQTPSDGR
jgi:trehalose-phosphatase